MQTQTIYAVAIENADIGCIDWFREFSVASEDFTSSKATFANDAITLFAIEVPCGLEASEVTDLVDDAMWSGCYQAISSHKPTVH